MSNKDDFQDLLQEAFHTYRLYLECLKIDIGGVTNIPLLKWPDLAQAAINYAEAVTPEQRKSTRTILRTDLCVLIAKPIEIIYQSAREHIAKHIGKEPKIVALSSEEMYKFPVQYKNRLVPEVNNLFKTLSTMTGIEYPELYRRNNGSNS